MSKTLLYGATKVDTANGAYAPVASLDQFQWKNRVLVVFADADNSRAARQENQLLAEREALAERDLVLIKVEERRARTLFGSAEPLDAEALTRELGITGPGVFSAVLVGKDGTVKLNVSEPIALQELFAIIDSMPMRAAESAKQNG